MVDVIVDGEIAYCLPDCTCCRACHKLIDEVKECPEADDIWNRYKCNPDCEYYEEIWDEEELKKELALDEDKTLMEPMEETND